VLEKFLQLGCTLLEFGVREFVTLGQNHYEGTLPVFQQLHHCHIPRAGVVAGINQDTHQAQLWAVFEVVSDKLRPQSALLLGNDGIAQTGEVDPHPAIVHQVEVHRPCASRCAAHARQAPLEE